MNQSEDSLEMVAHNDIVKIRKGDVEIIDLLDTFFEDLMDVDFLSSSDTEANKDGDDSLPKRSPGCEKVDESAAEGKELPGGSHGSNECCEENEVLSKERSPSQTRSVSKMRSRSRSPSASRMRSVSRAGSVSSTQSLSQTSNASKKQLGESASTALQEINVSREGRERSMSIVSERSMSISRERSTSRSYRRSSSRPSPEKIASRMFLKRSTSKVHGEKSKYKLRRRSRSRPRERNRSRIRSERNLFKAYRKSKTRSYRERSLSVSSRELSPTSRKRLDMSRSKNENFFYRHSRLRKRSLSRGRSRHLSPFRKNRSRARHRSISRFRRSRSLSSCSPDRYSSRFARERGRSRVRYNRKHSPSIKFSEDEMLNIMKEKFYSQRFDRSVSRTSHESNTSESKNIKRKSKIMESTSTESGIAVKREDKQISEFKEIIFGTSKRENSDSESRKEGKVHKSKKKKRSKNRSEKTKNKHSKIKVLKDIEMNDGDIKGDEMVPSCDDGGDEAQENMDQNSERVIIDNTTQSTLQLNSAEHFSGDKVNNDKAVMKLDTHATETESKESNSVQDRERRKLEERLQKLEERKRRLKKELLNAQFESKKDKLAVEEYIEKHRCDSKEPVESDDKKHITKWDVDKVINIAAKEHSSRHSSKDICSEDFKKNLEKKLKVYRSRYLRMLEEKLERLKYVYAEKERASRHDVKGSSHHSSHGKPRSPHRSRHSSSSSRSSHSRSRSRSQTNRYRKRRRSSSSSSGASKRKSSLSIVERIKRVPFYMEIAQKLGISSSLAKQYTCVSEKTSTTPSVTQSPAETVSLQTVTYTNYTTPPPNTFYFPDFSVPPPTISFYQQCSISMPVAPQMPFAQNFPTFPNNMPCMAPMYCPPLPAPLPETVTPSVPSLPGLSIETLKQPPPPAPHISSQPPFPPLPPETVKPILPPLPPSESSIPSLPPLPTESYAAPPPLPPEPAESCKLILPPLPPEPADSPQPAPPPLPFADADPPKPVIPLRLPLERLETPKTEAPSLPHEPAELGPSTAPGQTPRTAGVEPQQPPVAALSLKRTDSPIVSCEAEKYRNLPNLLDINVPKPFTVDQCHVPQVCPEMMQISTASGMKLAEGSEMSEVVQTVSRKEFMKVLAKEINTKKVVVKRKHDERFNELSYFVSEHHDNNYDVKMWLKSVNLSLYNWLFDGLGYEAILDITQEKLARFSIKEDEIEKIMFRISQLNKRPTRLRALEANIMSGDYLSLICALEEMESILLTPMKPTVDLCDLDDVPELIVRVFVRESRNRNKKQKGTAGIEKLCVQKFTSLLRKSLDRKVFTYSQRKKIFRWHEMFTELFPYEQWNTDPLPQEPEPCHPWPGNENFRPNWQQPEASSFSEDSWCLGSGPPVNPMHTYASDGFPQAATSWTAPIRDPLQWESVDPQYGCPPHFAQPPPHDHKTCPHNFAKKPIPDNQTKEQDVAKSKVPDQTLVSAQSTTVVHLLNDKEKTQTETDPFSVSSIVRVQTTEATSSEDKRGSLSKDTWATGGGAGSKPQLGTTTVSSEQKDSDQNFAEVKEEATEKLDLVDVQQRSRASCLEVKEHSSQVKETDDIDKKELALVVVPDQTDQEVRQSPREQQLPSADSVQKDTAENLDACIASSDFQLKNKQGEEPLTEVCDQKYFKNVSCAKSGDAENMILQDSSPQINANFGPGENSSMIDSKSASLGAQPVSVDQGVSQDMLNITKPHADEASPIHKSLAANETTTVCDEEIVKCDNSPHIMEEIQQPDKSSAAIESQSLSENVTGIENSSTTTMEEVVSHDDYLDTKKSIVQPEGSSGLENHSQSVVVVSGFMKREAVTNQEVLCAEDVLLGDNTSEGVISHDQSFKVKEEIMQPEDDSLIDNEAQSLPVSSSKIQEKCDAGDWTENTSSMNTSALSENATTLNEEVILLCDYSQVKKDDVEQEESILVGKSRVKEEILQPEESMALDNESQSSSLSLSVQQNAVHGICKISNQADLHVRVDTAVLNEGIISHMSSKIKEEIVIQDEAIISDNESQCLPVREEQDDNSQTSCNTADILDMNTSSTSTLDTAMLHEEVILRDELYQVKEEITHPEGTMVRGDDSRVFPVSSDHCQQGITQAVCHSGNHEDVCVEDSFYKQNTSATEDRLVNKEVLTGKSVQIKEEVREPDASLLISNEPENVDLDGVQTEPEVPQEACQEVCKATVQQHSSAEDVLHMQERSDEVMNSVTLNEEEFSRDSSVQIKKEKLVSDDSFVSSDESQPLTASSFKVKCETSLDPCCVSDREQVSILQDDATETPKNMSDDTNLCDSDSSMEDETTQSEQNFLATTHVGSFRIKQEAPQVDDTSSNVPAGEASCDMVVQDVNLCNENSQVMEKSIEIKQESEQTELADEDIAGVCSMKIEIEQTDLSADTTVSSTPLVGSGCCHAPALELESDNSVADTKIVSGTQTLYPSDCSNMTEPTFTYGSLQQSGHVTDHVEGNGNSKKGFTDNEFVSCDAVKQPELAIKVEINSNPSPSPFHTVACEFSEVSQSSDEQKPKITVKSVGPTLFNLQQFGSRSFWHRSDASEKVDNSSKKFEFVGTEQRGSFSLCASPQPQQTDANAGNVTQNLPSHTMGSYRTTEGSPIRQSQGLFTSTGGRSAVKIEQQVQRKHHKRRRDKSHGSRKRVRNCYVVAEDSSIEDELVLKVNQVSLSQLNALPVEVTDDSADSEEEPLSVLRAKKFHKCVLNEDTSANSLELSDVSVVQETSAIADRVPLNPKNRKRRSGGPGPKSHRKTKKTSQKGNSFKPESEPLITVSSSENEAQSTSVSSTVSSVVHHRPQTKKKTAKANKNPEKAEQKHSSSREYRTRVGRKTAAINYCEPEEGIVVESELSCLADEFVPDCFVVEDDSHQVQNAELPLVTPADTTQKTSLVHTRKRKRARHKKNR